MTSVSRLFCFFAAVLLVAGCTTSPPKNPPPAAVVKPLPPANFTLHYSELDTWNAVGQLLVRMEGVTYHGRAQKLGLYDVEYRGDRFLVFTKALWLSDEIKTLTTEVRVTQQDGKPNHGAPAIELLGMLQARLPGEILRIATEKKKPPVKKTAARKKTAKP